MAPTTAIIALALVICIVVVLLIGLYEMRRNGKEIAWSLYIPLLFHFICSIDLLINTLTSNFKDTNYAIVYGLSVASFYYILVKRVALLVINTVYQWSKLKFYLLSICAFIAGILSMITTVSFATSGIIFCIFIIHISVIRKLCNLQFMKMWKLHPFIVTRTYEYNVKKMELITIGYIKKELMTLDSKMNIPSDVAALIYNHYLYITYDKEVTAYKRDIEKDYHHEEKKVPKHIKQFHVHLWKMVILSSISNIAFLTIMLLYTIAIYRKDYNKATKISLNMIVPILLVIEAFCLLISFKPGEMIYNKLCLKNIVEKSYMKNYVRQEIQEEDKQVITSAPLSQWIENEEYAHHRHTSVDISVTFE